VFNSRSYATLFIIIVTTAYGKVVTAVWKTDKYQ